MELEMKKQKKWNPNPVRDRVVCGCEMCNVCKSLEEKSSRIFSENIWIHIIMIVTSASLALIVTPELNSVLLWRSMEMILAMGIVSYQIDIIG